MAKHSDELNSLVETLNPVDDERLASLSQKQAAQALYEEVTSMSSSTSPQRTRPRRRGRLIWQGALVVGTAVVVLAILSIVNVFGGDGPSIVDKAAAAIDPGQNTIVHVKITGTESGQGGYVSNWTEENWTLTSPPYTYREIQAFEGSPVIETVQNDDGLSQAYVAGTNTIYQPDQRVGFRVAGGQADPYRDMILEMLTSGEAVVEGAETVDGRECIVIAATKDYGVAADGTEYGTWYVVDAKTYNPVEWRMTREGGKVATIRFEVYEHLPADDEGLALLNLTAQHPGAAFSTSLEAYQEAMGVPNAEPGPEKGAGH